MLIQCNVAIDANEANVVCVSFKMLHYGILYYTYRWHSTDTNTNWNIKNNITILKCKNNVMIIRS